MNIDEQLQQDVNTLAENGAVDIKFHVSRKDVTLSSVKREAHEMMQAVIDGKYSKAHCLYGFEGVHV